MLVETNPVNRITCLPRLVLMFNPAQVTSAQFGQIVLLLKFKII